MTVTEFQKMMEKIEKVAGNYGLRVIFASNGNDNKVEIILDKQDEEDDG